MIETAIETVLISLLMAVLCVAWAWLVAPFTKDLEGPYPRAPFTKDEGQ